MAEGRTLSSAMQGDAFSTKEDEKTINEETTTELDLELLLLAMTPYLTQTSLLTQQLSLGLNVLFDPLKLMNAKPSASYKYFPVCMIMYEFTTVDLGLARENQGKESSSVNEKETQEGSMSVSPIPKHKCPSWH